MLIRQQQPSLLGACSNRHMVMFLSDESTHAICTAANQGCRLQLQSGPSYSSCTQRVIISCCSIRSPAAATTTDSAEQTPTISRCISASRWWPCQQSCRQTCTFHRSSPAIFSTTYRVCTVLSLRYPSTPACVSHPSLTSLPHLKASRCLLQRMQK